MVTGTQTYLPFGYVRTSSGNLFTDYTFTGQKSDANQIMFYQSRYYDPALSRFAQPDSIVPNVYNPQSLNHYSYVLNNPLRYVDPSGHAQQRPGGPTDDPNPCETDWCWENQWYTEHGYTWNDGESDWKKSQSESAAMSASNGVTRAGILQLARLGQLKVTAPQLLGTNLPETADELLGALMATGEMQTYCVNEASCREAFKAILTTVVNRSAAIAAGANYLQLDRINSYGSIIAGGCQTRCSQYAGLENWIKGGTIWNMDNETTAANFAVAFKVAVEVFKNGVTQAAVSEGGYVYTNLAEPTGGCNGPSCEPMTFDTTKKPTYFYK